MARITASPFSSRTTFGTPPPVGAGGITSDSSDFVAGRALGAAAAARACRVAARAIVVDMWVFTAGPDYTAGYIQGVRDAGGAVIFDPSLPRSSSQYKVFCSDVAGPLIVPSAPVSGGPSRNFASQASNVSIGAVASTLAERVVNDRDRQAGASLFAAQWQVLQNQVQAAQSAPDGGRGAMVTMTVPATFDHRSFAFKKGYLDALVTSGTGLSLGGAPKFGSFDPNAWYAGASWVPNLVTTTGRPAYTPSGTFRSGSIGAPLSAATSFSAATPVGVASTFRGTLSAGGFGPSSPGGVPTSPGSAGPGPSYSPGPAYGATPPGLTSASPVRDPYTTAADAANTFVSSGCYVLATPSRNSINKPGDTTKLALYRRASDVSAVNPPQFVFFNDVVPVPVPNAPWTGRAGLRRVASADNMPVAVPFSAIHC